MHFREYLLALIWRIATPAFPDAWRRLAVYVFEVVVGALGRDSCHVRHKVMCDIGENENCRQKAYYPRQIFHILAVFSWVQR